MSDPTYESAVKRLAALLEEKRELEAIIYSRLAGSQVAPAAPQQVAQHCAGASVEVVMPLPPTLKRGSVTETLVRASMEIIGAAGAPMKLGAIYTALIGRGVTVPGNEPRNNLGAKLSADRRLRTIPGRGWWFADEDPPPEGERRPHYSHKHAEGPEAEASEPLYLNAATSTYGLAASENP